MGFTTTFWGQVELRPALDQATRARLHDWSARDHRDGSTPSIWCGWIPTHDGTALIWNQSEKFYEADKWMGYLIDRFIAPKHTANGVVYAYAEPEGLGYFDVWRLDVVDNIVSVAGYDVPILQFDVENEELVERLAVCSAIDRYAARPDVGLGAIEAELRLIRDQLEHPAVADGLARFLRDAADVLPEPERLRRALEPFLALRRQS